MVEHGQPAGCRGSGPRRMAPPIVRTARLSLHRPLAKREHVAPPPDVCSTCSRRVRRAWPSTAGSRTRRRWRSSRNSCPTFDRCRRTVRPQRAGRLSWSRRRKVRDCVDAIASAEVAVPVSGGCRLNVGGSVDSAVTIRVDLGTITATVIRVALLQPKFRFGIESE